MQYTGLHDRNGVEICEDDLFESNGFIAVIKFRNGGYFLDWIGKKLFGSHDDLYRNAGEGKVIGNVWEHPELLEVSHAEN